jgi:hypothetical protein
VADERPIVYLEAGRPVYRASASGYCRRMLGAARLGYVPKPDSEYLLLAAREGQRHEEWIVEDLVREGWQVFQRQKEIEVDLGALVVRGHVDGVAARGKRELYVLEIKTMSRWMFGQLRREGISYKHRCQMAVYSRALGLPALYVVKCRDTGETERYVVNDLDFREVEERLLEVELAALKDRLPKPDDDLCFGGRCQYDFLCPRGVL